MTNKFDWLKGDHVGLLAFPGGLLWGIIDCSACLTYRNHPLSTIFGSWEKLCDANTVVSYTYTENGKKLRNFFIREFPIESIGKCNRVGICYNHYGNFS